MDGANGIERRWPVIRGGRYHEQARRRRPLAYSLHANEMGGRPWVIFDRCPTDSENVFDLIWYLDEAIERGFIVPPRIPLTIAARGVGR